MKILKLACATNSGIENKPVGVMKQRGQRQKFCQRLQNTRPSSLEGAYCTKRSKGNRNSTFSPCKIAILRIHFANANKHIMSSCRIQIKTLRYAGMESRECHVTFPTVFTKAIWELDTLPPPYILLIVLKLSLQYADCNCVNSVAGSKISSSCLCLLMACSAAPSVMQPLWNARGVSHIGAVQIAATGVKT